jgi:hypothetical protein
VISCDEVDYQMFKTTNDVSKAVRIKECAACARETQLENYAAELTSAV